MKPLRLMIFVSTLAVSLSCESEDGGILLDEEELVAVVAGDQQTSPVDQAAKQAIAAPAFAGDLKEGPVVSPTEFSSPTSVQPTELTVKIWTSTTPAHNEFTRYVRFVDIHGNQIDVAVDFSRTSTNFYEGTVSGTAINALDPLTWIGNRTYWDDMRFVNKGGATALAISRIEVHVVYVRTDLGPLIVSDDDMLVGLEYGKTLGAGNTSFNFTQWRGRLAEFNATLGTSYSFSSLPWAVRAMIMDLGKSGTDENHPNISNPKYGFEDWGHNCTETISWYYSQPESEITWANHAFDNLATVEAMNTVFRNANRLFCYHEGLQRFQKVTPGGEWVLPFDEHKYSTKEGDYFARVGTWNPDSDPPEGLHSMMLVSWDEYTDVAWVMQGPFPVNMLRWDVYDRETHGDDFCIGSI